MRSLDGSIQYSCTVQRSFDKAIGECLNKRKNPPSPRKRSSLVTEPCHWAAALGRCGLGENEEMNFKKHS